MCPVNWAEFIKWRLRFIIESNGLWDHPGQLLHLLMKQKPRRGKDTNWIRKKMVWEEKDEFVISWRRLLRYMAALYFFFFFNSGENWVLQQFKLKNRTHCNISLRSFASFSFFLFHFQLCFQDCCCVVFSKFVFLSLGFYFICKMKDLVWLIQNPILFFSTTAMPGLTCEGVTWGEVRKHEGESQLAP